MKKFMLCLIAFAFSFAFLMTASARTDVADISSALQRGAIESECRLAPTLGKMWHEHCLGAAFVSNVTAQTYTGSAITPTPGVLLNGSALTPSTDFVYDYANNTNAGVATVTVKANKAGYFGSIARRFVITTATVTESMIGTISAQTATGQPVTPEPTITFASLTLVKGTDYTLSYANNVEAGTTAKVIVTGIGNFTGSAEKTFTINPAQ